MIRVRAGSRRLRSAIGWIQLRLRLRSARSGRWRLLVSFPVGNDFVNGETIRIDGAQRFGIK
jgi:hypothetical protein